MTIIMMSRRRSLTMSTILFHRLTLSHLLGATAPFQGPRWLIFMIFVIFMWWGCKKDENYHNWCQKNTSAGTKCSSSSTTRPLATALHFKPGWLFLKYFCLGWKLFFLLLSNWHNSTLNPCFIHWRERESCKRIDCICLSGDNVWQWIQNGKFNLKSPDWIRKRKSFPLLMFGGFYWLFLLARCRHRRKGCGQSCLVMTG